MKLHMVNNNPKKSNKKKRMNKNGYEFINNDDLWDEVSRTNIQEQKKITLITNNN